MLLCLFFVFRGESGVRARVGYIKLISGDDVNIYLVRRMVASHEFY